MLAMRKCTLLIKQNVLNNTDNNPFEFTFIPGGTMLATNPAVLPESAMTEVEAECKPKALSTAPPPSDLSLLYPALVDDPNVATTLLDDLDTARVDYERGSIEAMLDALRVFDGYVSAESQYIQSSLSTALVGTAQLLLTLANDGQVPAAPHCRANRCSPQSPIRQTLRGVRFGYCLGYRCSRCWRYTGLQPSRGRPSGGVDRSEQRRFHMADSRRPRSLVFIRSQSR